MSFRAQRIEESIRTELSEIIQFNMQDPRLPAIFSITGVKVTPDLSLAKVYFTQMPEDEESIDETLDALEHAHGYLRTELAQRIQLKHALNLAFFFDEMQKEASRIEELLEKAKSQSPKPDEDEKESTD